MDVNKDYFKFTPSPGGYFPFEGVFDNGKEIDEIIVDRDNNVATINYADGCSYSVSAVIEKNGNNFTISDIMRTWSFPTNSVNNIGE